MELIKCLTIDGLFRPTYLNIGTHLPVHSLDVSNSFRESGLINEM